MKRYNLHYDDFDNCDCCMEKCRYVLFTDHEAALEKQRSDFVELMASLITDKEQEYQSLLEHHEAQTKELQAALSADEEENKRLTKALKDISVVGLLSDEKDSPRAKRMREIAREVLN